MKVIAYYRVSKAVQGLNGLGMDAQRASVEAFIKAGNHELVSSFSEVETGKHQDRPQLQKAISACKEGGYTLLLPALIA